MRLFCFVQAKTLCRYGCMYWSICKVVVVSYVVSAVVAVTVMHVLLFVLHVCVCVCCENVRV